MIASDTSGSGFLTVSEGSGDYTYNIDAKLVTYNIDAKLVPEPVKDPDFEQREWRREWREWERALWADQPPPAPPMHALRRQREAPRPVLQHRRRHPARVKREARPYWRRGVA